MINGPCEDNFRARKERAFRGCTRLEVKLKAFADNKRGTKIITQEIVDVLFFVVSNIETAIIFLIPQPGPTGTILIVFNLISCFGRFFVASFYPQRQARFGKILTSLHAEVDALDG